jgi:quercetin dioxygenase-like cupin family protein
MKTLRSIRAGMTGVLACALGTLALATPSSGILSATVVARGGFADNVDLKFKVGDGPNDVIHVGQSQDTVMQQIVIAPGGHTGWHSHPGPVVVVITAGAMTFYDGDDPACTPRVYTAGQAFVDSGQGHVHIARNEQNENLVLWATYFDVPVGGGFRIDAADPGNCSAPKPRQE